MMPPAALGGGAMQIDGSGSRPAVLAPDQARPRAEIDVWAALADAVDPSLARPRLAPHVELRLFDARGARYGIAANTRDIIHLRLDEAETALLASMDGTRTVAELVVDHALATGHLDTEGVADLVAELRADGFLDEPFVDVAGAVAAALDDPTPWERVRRLWSRSFSIEWDGAERFVAALHRRGLRLAFTRVGGALSLVVGVLGLVAFVAVGTAGQGRIGANAASDALVLIVLGWVATGVHELGHALVLVDRGRRIRCAGFMIYFGSPAFFVDSTDGLVLSRRDRVLQALAGPYAEFVLSGVAAIVAWTMPDTWVGQTLFACAALNYFVLLLNLAPFLELDGYWILVELLRTPDLRPRSFAFVRHELPHRLRHAKPLTLEETALTLYAVLGVAFTVFSLTAALWFWHDVFGALVSALWALGIPGQLLLAVIAVFVAGPLVRGVLSLVALVVRHAGAAADRIRFRRERDWRVEAAELLDANPLFADLPVEALNDLAGRVRLRDVHRGEAIVRQGDAADAFYVVRIGRCDVVEEDPRTGAERVLRSLGRGDSFGELALLDGATRRATVRAVEDGEVFEVGRSAFDRCLAPSLRRLDQAPTVQAILELRSVRSFEHLPPARLAALVEFGTWATHAPGDVIVRRGATGDSFYAVLSGQVEVVRGGVVVARLGAGDHFGELALLSGRRRRATVRAVTPVRVFRLDAVGFRRLVRRASIAPPATHRPETRSWEH